MIYHNVCFKLKESATDKDIEDMIKALNSLPTDIQEIKFLKAGHNFSDRSQGFSIHLVSTFENKNALNTYIEHPAHVAAVKNYIKPILNELVVNDIEV